MALIASHYVNQAEVESAVRRVEKSFSSRVVRIGYTLEEDHVGHPSISFRILVYDEVGPVAKLRQLWGEISRALMNEVKTEENGLHSYHSFRTVSEQEKLRDPAWD
jgi:hypothetical protein